MPNERSDIKYFFVFFCLLQQIIIKYFSGSYKYTRHKKKIQKQRLSHHQNMLLNIFFFFFFVFSFCSFNFNFFFLRACIFLPFCFYFFQQHLNKIFHLFLYQNNQTKKYQKYKQKILIYFMMLKKYKKTATKKYKKNVPSMNIPKK